MKTPPSPTALAPAEREALLGVARRAIELRAQTGDDPESEALRPDPLTARLAEPSGAFVTLTLKGDLRGCIGHIHAVEPLWLAVAENATHAGWHDPRFRCVRPDEVSGLVIEVTVIGPLEEIAGPDDVVIGQHGVMITCATGRGVLLPQVASERGWDAETFLTQVCIKAHLPRDTWRRGEATLLRFGAEHFVEAPRR